MAHRGVGRNTFIRFVDINKLTRTHHITPRMLVPRGVGIIDPPPALVSFITEAEFGGPLSFRSMVSDAPLISAFVERWRSETNTFHLPWGEYTITLQDVAYHLSRLPTWLTTTPRVPLLSAQPTSILRTLNHVHLVPDTGGHETPPLGTPHRRVRPEDGTFPLRPITLIRYWWKFDLINTKYRLHPVNRIHILTPLHARRSASRQRMSTRIVKRLELTAIMRPMPESDTKCVVEEPL
ncbi:hypothetical protein PIB30_066741 [Stylosanthes scabra]|uniref:Aminotransferase-like plant mobile domain-containing protein n=1 Tax=Stylosanthes scabra TaxID=79078 RepID=A0ABU6UNE6_9FABA|nr:hypothetical protein [Stylosanthes scabra]